MQLSETTFFAHGIYVQYIFVKKCFVTVNSAGKSVYTGIIKIHWTQFQF